jgi:tripartite-type tricarboxylate transporter receptor subunit TctC
MVAQAEAICSRMNQRFDAEGKPGVTVGDIARITPHRAVVEAQTVRELKALTPPAQLAHDWRQIVSYRQTLALELAQLGHAAKAKDTRAIVALAATKKRVHAKLGAIAKQAGLGECGRTG